MKDTRGMKKTIIKDIGEVNLRKSRKARRISLKIDKKGDILVVMPYWIPYSMGINFAGTQKKWISRQKVKLAENTTQITVQNSGEAIDVLRSKARGYLPVRLRELAEEHDYKYGKVSLRNQKTLWGSCSGKNNISLNINLMQLPPQLIDYVILHELTHTVHKNHGPGFWNAMEEKMNNSRKLAKELRSYRLVELA